MNEEELIRETRKLIGRWDNIRIVGQGWAGDARRGFQFNPIRTAFGGVTPVTPSGACCPISGDCFISTQVVCEGGGGIYQGNGTLCVPDPCTPDTGACCIGSDCSIESESDCTGMGGIFQGVDTTCSPNPCPPPTGACCVGTDCTIETESDCTGMGGTYQGDDTTCDPNPCEVQPCCIGGAFNSFDGSGAVFLSYHRVITGHYEYTATHTGDCFFDFSVTLDGSANYEAHYAFGGGGECVFVVDDDTSSSSRTGGDPCGPIASLACLCNVTSEGNECTSPLDYCQCGMSGPSITMDITATTQITTWNLDASCHIDCETGTYDCHRSGSYIMTETLSNQCIPV